MTIFTVGGGHCKNIGANGLTPNPQGGGGGGGATEPHFSKKKFYWKFDPLIEILSGGPDSLIWSAKWGEENKTKK